MLQAHTEVKATKMIASKQVAMLGIISSMGQNHFTDGVGRSELTGSHPVISLCSHSPSSHEWPLHLLVQCHSEEQ